MAVQVWHAKNHAMNYSGMTCLCASGMSMHCDTQVYNARHRNLTSVVVFLPGWFFRLQGCTWWCGHLAVRAVWAADAGAAPSHSKEQVSRLLWFSSPTMAIKHHCLQHHRSLLQDVVAGGRACTLCSQYFFYLLLVIFFKFTVSMYCCTCPVACWHSYAIA